MRKIKFYLTIGCPGSNQEEIAEYDDDITDEEIQQDLEIWAGDYIDFNWREINEEDAE